MREYFFSEHRVDRSIVFILIVLFAAPIKAETKENLFLINAKNKTAVKKSLKGKRKPSSNDVAESESTAKVNPKNGISANTWDLVFSLNPGYRLYNQILQSTGEKVSSSGSATGNVSLGVTRQIMKELALSYVLDVDHVTVPSATPETFTVLASAKTLVSHKFRGEYLNLLENGSTLRPMISIGLEESPILEFQSNTELSLNSIKDLVVQVGVNFGTPLDDETSNTLHLDFLYQKDLNLFSTAQTVWVTGEKWTLAIDVIHQLHWEKYSMLLGVKFERKSNTFLIQQDLWMQTCTFVTGIIGLNRTF